jgi:hypothetical protein
MPNKPIRGPVSVLSPTGTVATRDGAAALLPAQKVGHFPSGEFCVQSGVMICGSLVERRMDGRHLPSASFYAATQWQKSTNCLDFATFAGGSRAAGPPEEEEEAGETPALRGYSLPALWRK